MFQCNSLQRPCVTLALWLTFAADNPATAADAPAPIHWKQSVFSIPYQMDRSVTAQNAPLEVRLMMSRDGGQTWQQLQTAQPHVKGFRYHAPEDGEYWFAVQTVDRFGNPHPAADFQPELHVVVDTTPPKLRVSGTVNTDGEVVLQYSAADPHLQPASLSVSAGSPEDGFQPLRTPDPPENSPVPLENQLTFAPPETAQTVQVRAEIADLAGNRSVAQIEVDSTATSERDLPLREASLAGAQASFTAGKGSHGASPGDDDTVRGNPNAWNSVGDGRYPTTPYSTEPPIQQSLLNPPGLERDDHEAASKPATQPWSVDQTAITPPQSPSTGRPPRGTDDPRPEGRNSSSAEELPAPRDDARPAWSTYQTSTPQAEPPQPNAGQQLPPSSQASWPLANEYTSNGSSAVIAEDIPPGETAGSSTLASERSSEYPNTGVPMIDVSRSERPEPSSDDSQSLPSSNSSAASTAATSTTSAFDSESSSSASAWQLVNSRTVAIDYEVASVGPWGVSEVALWGSRDGGQTWRRYTVDDDNRSPVMTTVEGEGEYGFRVVVHSAGGFAAPPPKSGDPPEALVRVDLVRPKAAIEAVKQGTGNRADQILIRWRAEDAQLARQPVALYYSSQPAGPWTTIAAGLENTGNYAWRAERHLPDQLYVRLEVRDAAGNVTTFQNAEPVTIRRPQPQARIREIRPYGASARPDRSRLR